MYVCCYGLSENDKRYTSQLADCGCIEGDRNELIKQIESDEKFCRDEVAIGYGYFVQCLRKDTFLYIKNESDEILGACTLDLGEYIFLHGICVPDNRIKGIGTLLLNNLKSIGKLINAIEIGLLAEKSVQEFYIKNGFIFDELDENKKDDDDYYDVMYGDSASMSYYFKQTSETIGGTKNITSRKNKKRNKKRNKKSKKKI